MTDDRAQVAAHARSLLGRAFTGHGVTVRITEVEAYGGITDPASHAYRRTARSEIMYGEPWRLYVYRSYGLHWCVNIVTGPASIAGAVLLRAGMVIDGYELARERRGGVPDERLARGPGNLGQALAITQDDLGLDVRDGGSVRLEPSCSGSTHEADISSGPRVGVSRAADVPWRFWISGHRSVSAYRRNPRADQ